MSTRVKGYCPMGCGQTLELTATGKPNCNSLDCPRPFAAYYILVDAEETGHIVQFRDDGYNCKHPLWERLDNQLLNCGIGDKINDVHDMDPDLRGTYRYEDNAWEELV